MEQPADLHPILCKDTAHAEDIKLRVGEGGAHCCVFNYQHHRGMGVGVEASPRGPLSLVSSLNHICSALVQITGH